MIVSGFFYREWDILSMSQPSRTSRAGGPELCQNIILVISRRFECSKRLWLY
jgi:hypothetical protein